MNLPIGLQILNWLNKISLLAYVILLLNLIIVISFSLHIGFMNQMALWLVKPLGLENSLSDVNQIITGVLGFYWIPILIIYLENVFIRRKQRRAFKVVIVIDILVSCTLHLTLLANLIFLLIIGRSSRSYFWQNEKNKNSDMSKVVTE